MQLVICVWSCGTAVLLLVHGGVFCLFVQLLGDYFPIQLCWNHPGHIAHLVLPGLPHGLDLFAGHCFSFSNRLSGGWSPSNRLNKTEAALYELHNVLRWLPVSSTTWFPLPLIRLQVHPKNIQVNIPIKLRSLQLEVSQVVQYSLWIWEPVRL